VKLCTYGFGQRVSISFGLYSWVFSFVVTILTIMLYCTFRSLSLLYFYVLLEQINSYLVFGLGVPTLSYIFIVLYFFGFSSFVGQYIVCL
jgi:hypothetical protein